MKDTIYAISTPLGKGGIGIIRISGNLSVETAGRVFEARGTANTAEKLANNPMKLIFGFFHAEDFDDKGYAVYIPESVSYTGEDTVELYPHGGIRIMTGIMDALRADGVRPAEAGEFTLRAYLGGKMSLADAEGVADMINATSAAGIRAAYRLMQGGLAEKINGIKSELLDAIATLEASLDYPDETEDEIPPALDVVIPSVNEKINALVKTSRRGRIAKCGVNVVIAGAPNVGKSSLLNAILGENRAIVTEVAGTTRDTVTGSAEIKGVLFNFSDTAGLRDSEDKVESIGIARAREAVEGADVVIQVLDATGEKSIIGLPKDRVSITVYNKCDLFCPKAEQGEFILSAKTGQGVDTLVSALGDMFLSGDIESGDVLTSERHISALYRAKSALESAIQHKNSSIDCVLIDLRESYDALGEITGDTATEDIVSAIFEKFCVGK